MNISKSTIRITFLIILCISIVYCLWLIRNGLYPFLIGLLLAYLLNPAVLYIEKKGFSRLSAILLLYCMLFLIIIIGGNILVPIILSELEALSQDIPKLVIQFNNLFQNLYLFYEKASLPYSLRLAIDDNLYSAEREVQRFILEIVGGIVGLISHSIGLAISPILAFYLLYDWKLIKRNFLLVTPKECHSSLLAFFRDADSILGGVIRGQLLIAAIVGIVATIGLYLLGVKFALLIGVAAGILDVIPYFGAIIGAAPAIFIAMLQSPALAIKTAILFLFIHQAEGSIIQPKVLGNIVGMHPITVIFCVFVGGELAGVTGMLLGVPIGAFIKLLIQHTLKVLF